MSLTHYIVIRRDLTFGEYSAQLAHAGEAYALSVRKDFERLGHIPPMNYDTIAVVKGARNEDKLAKLERELIKWNIQHVAVREELGEKGGRLAGQLTCISLMPDERARVEPLVRDEMVWRPPQGSAVTFCEGSDGLRGGFLFRS